jgi:tetratricopeptide (TPR) repeat protein
MTTRQRWAAALTGLLSAALLASLPMADGGVGGKPVDRGKGNAGGQNPGVGAMRPSAPAGGAAARPNNSRAQPNNSRAQQSPRGGLAGTQGGGARQNSAASRPDLGIRSGQTTARNPQNLAQTRQQNTAPANRPGVAASSRPGGGNSAAFANRPDLGGASRPGASRPGASAVAGGNRTRPNGLSPTIKPANTPGPAGSNLAGSPAMNRPGNAGNRASITGSRTAGNLAGITASPGSSIPNSRPDLGGATRGRPNTVLKPAISDPGSNAPGINPLPNQSGDNRPGGNRPGDNRPGGNRPDGTRPGDNRPGNNRPGDNNRRDWWANRPNRPDSETRPGGGGEGTRWNGRDDNRWSGGGESNRWSGNNWNNNRNWTSNNRYWNTNNNWTSNQQDIVNNSPTIVNAGYRPGFAVPGYGYGYGGNWGYGQQRVYDNSWQSGPGWTPAYTSLHDDWCHGSWSGYSGDNSNWLNSASGAATGWLTSWAFGSRPYNWGYSTYSNPYVGTTSQSLVNNYDYSQPINTEVAPPAEEQALDATAMLDQARQSFQNGSYRQALALANQVVASLPNDPAVHEFRALALFALARYDEASQALYPALSVGPGWDWTTMSGLYPSVQAYQQQLTSLESFTQNHPDQAAPRFLLAYHYLTLGYNDAAADQLRDVVQLKPADKLSRQMLSLLDSAKKQAGPANQVPTSPQAAIAGQQLVESPATVRPTQLIGAWTAKPDDKTTIKLTLDADGKFVWDVAQGGKPNQLRGTFAIGGGDLLTLAQDQQGGTLAGNIAMNQNDRFTFRLAGAPASDPGLTFVRQL